MAQTIVILGLFAFSYLLYYVITLKKNKTKYYLPKNIKETYLQAEISVDKINILTRDYYETNKVRELYGAAEFKEIHKYISVLSCDDFLYRGKTYSFKSVPIDLSDSELKSLLKEKKQLQFILIVMI